MQSGDVGTARAVFDQMIAPINRIANQGAGIFYYVHKELLRQRGVIATNKVRSPSPPIDSLTQRELQSLIHELYPRNVA
jgi:dihydrodipicolinate synthase/N-acetylneuraminate lyase